jgi:hypothetical protein
MGIVTTWDNRDKTTVRMEFESDGRGKTWKARFKPPTAISAVSPIRWMSLWILRAQTCPKIL